MNRRLITIKLVLAAILTSCVMGGGCLVVSDALNLGRAIVQ